MSAARQSPDRPPLPVAELASLASTLEDVTDRLAAIASARSGSGDADAFTNELYSVETALRQGGRRLQGMIRRVQG